MIAEPDLGRSICYPETELIRQYGSVPELGGGCVRTAAACSAVLVLLQLDHPSAPLRDLAIAHNEHLGHGHAHHLACVAGRRTDEFRHDDVVLFHHADDL